MDNRHSEQSEESAQPVIRRLLSADNPSVVLKVRVNVLGESADSVQVQDLRKQIKSSHRAQQLLSHRRDDGTIPTPPYKKWQGPHWTLVSLADIGYPSGDTALKPMRDQFYDWLFSERHMNMPATLIIPGQEDRVRRCASQEGNAVWYSLLLGLEDERTELLVDRLKQWQWPDGGWNCDKRPEARISSFQESIVPLRALALHGRMKGDQQSLAVASRTVEYFLKRRLYKRQRDGKVIKPTFAQLQYPYRDYSLLFGLVVIAEAGYITDDRCRDALDLLESKRLADGGFPAERTTYRTVEEIATRGEFVNWGPHGKTRSNEFVTADALYVLKEAGRL